MPKNFISASETIRILCAGNELHGDDGFGPALAARLSKLPLPAGVGVYNIGVRGLDAIGFFEECSEILLVDVIAGDTPGKLHCLSPADLPQHTSNIGHGAGIIDLLRLAGRLISPMPRTRILLAEIDRITPFCMELSPALQIAVQYAIDYIGSQYATDITHFVAS